MTKVLIALATYNRPIVTGLCLDNLRRCLDSEATLAVYDDCSTAYDESFLRRYTPHVTRFSPNRGVNLSRLYAFREFVDRYTEHDLIYLTDNDTVHDPAFLPLLRKLYDGQPEGAKLPIGLYNSVFHGRAENNLREMDSFYIRRTCPGVSQCFNRSMVRTMLRFLDANPGFEQLSDFDLKWPMAVGMAFVQTKRSYVEHFARDRNEGGMHARFSGDAAGALADFDRDRAVNPTPFLAGIRDRVIEAIMGQPLAALRTAKPTVRPAAAIA